MASIFTYDPDPPRVASPWLTAASSGTSIPVRSIPPTTPGRTDTSLPVPGVLTDYGLTRLEPEPQEGPVEFKLHLLLRPRRSHDSSSPETCLPGSYRATDLPQHRNGIHPSDEIPMPSPQARQNRLQQLTTQLLWRLQQSSPFHSPAANDLILPRLPESASSLTLPSQPARLLPGLEGSRGALYEIGVSDDGTLVGITKEEMDESLTNLRAMAASLGCTVDVTRMVAVGECKWRSRSDAMSYDEDSTVSGLVTAEVALRHLTKLWVAEALVVPLRTVETRGNSVSKISSTISVLTTDAEKTDPAGAYNSGRAQTQQLRITLTGPTTSGKSSLLGTLSTSTLDNGRGKSRLSLLRHRHELASGITSSVAQELIGYRPPMLTSNASVVNYAASHVSSWNDVHASAEGGRLVFMSDSAGHPRYRRTTVRGLVGWAPHWTMLCIAADDGETASQAVGATSSAQDILGTAGVGVDLTSAHLDLCLKLDNPLVIVVTKLDLARSRLRQNLSKILSALKAAGRMPVLLPPDSQKVFTETELETIPQKDLAVVKKVVDQMDPQDLKHIVPIIITSAKGSGISLLHALLYSLPIPHTPTSQDYVEDMPDPEQPSCLFHVEEVFGLPAAFSVQTDNSMTQLEAGVVVAGYLRFGDLSIGDKLVVGPFPVDMDDVGPQRKVTNQSSSSQDHSNLSGSGSFSLGAHRMLTLDSSGAVELRDKAVSSSNDEWQNARIVSIRNLRLPVRHLSAGQVGTIGIIFESPEEQISRGTSTNAKESVSTPRIRKGMVLAIPSLHMLKTGHPLQAVSGLTAAFDDDDVNSVTPGSLVVIYVASIRATARVIRLGPTAIGRDVDAATAQDSEELFGLEEAGGTNHDDAPVFGTCGVTAVTLELITCREWIEMGSQILIMPGGGQGLSVGSGRGGKGFAGLDGFVGKVIELAD